MGFDNNYKFTASCLAGTVSAIRVLIGVNDVNIQIDTNDRVGIMAKMWISHPNYDAVNILNNLALVYLPVDIYHSRNSVAAINLLYTKDPTLISVFVSSFDSQNVKVAGWGVSDVTTTDTSSTLKEAEMQITSGSSCRSNYASATSKEICVVPTTDQIACTSDEGSPVTLNGKLIGIISDVTTDCQTASMQLVCSIYPFHDWIITKLKQADRGIHW